jgi:hypothetical protein
VLGIELAVTFDEQSHLLQNCSRSGEDSFVMPALVADLYGRWALIASLDSASPYAVESRKLEPWGLNVAYGFAPSHVPRLRGTTLLRVRPSPWLRPNPKKGVQCLATP